LNPSDPLQKFNWIVTAYSLCSTAFIPAFGQIADTFGHHAALQISMLCMLIGSTLCAAAQTWAMLLLGRAFQGVSAAGIANIIKIVLADKVTLAEQAKNNTIFMLVAGLSTGAGPVIRGSLAVTN
jgi:MFS family permease